MKTRKRSAARAGFAVCSVLAAALAGCTTYVEQPAPRAVYAPPPPAGPPAPPAVYVPPPSAPAEVVIQTESDFYQPLSPYGEWVVVASYGRCWRPARVEAGWRPYCNGHWERTDAGWYWASDEPWGWATYHYGRWDWNAGFGWFWVPQKQWAPAWVAWRQGAGYVGWAPLPPSARFAAGGFVEVRDTAIAPRGFVFVEERRILDPVRPKTVIINNATIINRTANITKVQLVNQTVINEGPRPADVERLSGRKIQPVPVRELRRQEEAAVVTRQRNIPSGGEVKVPSPTGRRPVPGEAKTLSPRETRPAAKPAEITKEPQQPGIERQRVKPGATPVEARPPGVRPEAKPGKAVIPRETRPAQKPADLGKQSPPAPAKGEVRKTGVQNPAPKSAPAATRPPQVKPAPKPGIRPEPPQPARPAVEQPAAAGKSGRLQNERQPNPSRVNPAAVETGGANAKKNSDRKKGEEPETPPDRPGASPRAPQ